MDKTVHSFCFTVLLYLWEDPLHPGPLFLNVSCSIVTVFETNFACVFHLTGYFSQHWIEDDTELKECLSTTSRILDFKFIPTLGSCWEQIICLVPFRDGEAKKCRMLISVKENNWTMHTHTRNYQVIFLWYYLKLYLFKIISKGIFFHFKQITIWTV